MTIIKIWKAKRELYEIQSIPEISEQFKLIKDLAKKVGAPIPPTIATRDEVVSTKASVKSTATLADPKELINEIVRNIHIVLQTEMMLQACIFAAMSAVVACISVILVLFSR